MHTARGLLGILRNFLSVFIIDKLRLSWEEIGA